MSYILCMMSMHVKIAYGNMNNEALPSVDTSFHIILIWPDVLYPVYDVYARENCLWEHE